MIVVPVRHAVVVSVTPRVGSDLAIPVARLMAPTTVHLGQAIRHPVVAAPLRHPVASMPVVAAALPLPVTGRPDVADARRGNDLVDRRRWRRADGETNAHVGLRCRW